MFFAGNLQFRVKSMRSRRRLARLTVLIGFVLGFLVVREALRMSGNNYLSIIQVSDLKGMLLCYVLILLTFTITANIARAVSIAHLI